jgi:hypothetical protein
MVNVPPVGEGDGLGDALGDGLALGEGDGLALGEGDGLALGLGEGLADGEALGLGDGDALGLGDGLGAAVFWTVAEVPVKRSANVTVSVMGPFGVRNPTGVVVSPNTTLT